MSEDLKYEVDANEECIHIHLEGCTVNIIRTDEGYVVDLWPPRFGQHCHAVASTYAYDAEIQEDV